MGRSIAFRVALLLGPAAVAAAFACAQPAPADGAVAASLVDRFEGRTLSTRKWEYRWGSVRVRSGRLTLASRPPRRPAQTYSALVTSRASFGDHAFRVRTKTVERLRRTTRPNTWEVGWVFFRFRDLENYYYFILKPNGWELGKKHGSDEQIFLATGGGKRLVLGRWHRIRIRATGARIRAWVDGARVLDFTDPDPIRTGKVGLYEEDARVRFDTVVVRP
ncbi:MAG TPA: family 16 glycoside hydrolase [Gaiellaceae bacterium]|nr:family 16 glycoside hydrolase [Gaiellaceae bacterium]